MGCEEDHGRAGRSQRRQGGSYLSPFKCFPLIADIISSPLFRIGGCNRIDSSTLFTSFRLLLRKQYLSHSCDWSFPCNATLSSPSAATI